MIRSTPRWTASLPDYAPDVRFSPDGTRLAAATVAGAVVTLDPDTGAARFRTAPHANGALSVAWCLTHPLLATGGADGAVALAAASDGAQRARTQLGEGWVDHLAWSPDGRVLAATVARSVCFVAPDGSLIGRFDGHPSTVSGLAWHEGRSAWLTSAYGVVSLLRPTDAEPLAQHYFRTSMLTVHPSPEGRFVASGTQDPLVHVWDLEDDANEVNLTGYAGKVAVLAWSPAEPRLATAAGSSVVVWDFAGGDPFRKKPDDLGLSGTGRVTALEFLPAGELLVGTDAGVVWCVEIGRTKRGRARSSRACPARCAASSRRPTARRWPSSRRAGAWRCSACRTARERRRGPRPRSADGARGDELGDPHRRAAPALGRSTLVPVRRLRRVDGRRAPPRGAAIVRGGLRGARGALRVPGGPRRAGPAVRGRGRACDHAPARRARGATADGRERAPLGRRARRVVGRW